MVLVALIAAAIVGSLVEYLLRQVLPEEPKRRHIIAVLIAIVVFAGIYFWASSRENNQANVAQTEVPIVMTTPLTGLPTTLLPILAKGNTTIQELGIEHISLTAEEIIIGTADRFQDKIGEFNPEYTIFVIYGPLETDLSMWWGGWDEWENATADFIEEQIQQKIEEIKVTHEVDYQTRGYRVIKCYGQITSCEIISTFPLQTDNTQSTDTSTQISLSLPNCEAMAKDETRTVVPDTFITGFFGNSCG